MRNDNNSNIQKTLMGSKVEVNDLANLTPQKIEIIINSVLKYGMCCIKQQKLKPYDLESLTKQLGELVELPPALAFDNQIEDCKAVVRVSNIDKNGNIIINHKGAEYWHQDGDFNIGKQRRIWNLLYSEIVPATGGATGFGDGRRILKILPKHLLKAIEEHQLSIDPFDIPDFKLTDKADRIKFPVVYHNMITSVKGVDDYVLYMGGINVAKIVGLDHAASEKLKDEIVAYLAREDNTYIHQWERGDIVIWDNMLVFHRSMGGYGNEKRLLYRTQARMFQ